MDRAGDLKLRPGGTARECHARLPGPPRPRADDAHVHVHVLLLLVRGRKRALGDRDRDGLLGLGPRRDM